MRKYVGDPLLHVRLDGSVAADEGDDVADPVDVVNFAVDTCLSYPSAYISEGLGRHSSLCAGLVDDSGRTYCRNCGRLERQVSVREKGCRSYRHLVNR